MIYSIYNTTPKSSKITNIINEHSDSCYAKALVKIADKEYIIERGAVRNDKSATGADTDLQFVCRELTGEEVCLNGTSKPNTDKNIRKFLGTVEDFYITSMATQLDSLKFITEGSAKRKAALAKFLDLQIFEGKFKHAKEESKDIRGALKRLEGIEYDKQIEEAKVSLTEKSERMEQNQKRCDDLQKRIDDLHRQVDSIKNKIESAPTEIIDPVKIRMEIETRTKNIKRIETEKENLLHKIEESKKKFSKISEFISQFDIDTYQERKSRIVENREKIDEYLKQLDSEGQEKKRLQKRTDLLSEVPCGDSFPDCKFIKNAHEATGLIKIKTNLMKDLQSNVEKLNKKVDELEPEKVFEYVEKFQQLVDKKTEVSDSIATAELSIDKNDSDLFKETTILEKLNAKLEEYEENKEAIENLEELISEKAALQKQINQSVKECEVCKNDTNTLLREVGSAEQQIKHLEETKQELETLRTEFSAYKLFMECCHPNGISHNIIKNRLPIINEEIAKILTGVVDFEIFIENDDKRLDIFIKHPKHGPRLIEMGSGAEKTIAAMAIRLALLSVSSLPKPDIFILDEPGTALDAENMEGFVRIIDMVKSYFKTVILISHLDTLKDAVDMQITIDKKNGFAHVSI
jgi:exonuclease SbcC